MASPFDIAWSVLKGDPRMQMFTGPGDVNLGQSFEHDAQHYPETERLRTVDPNIAAMIARNRNHEIGDAEGNPIVGIESIAGMANEPRDDWSTGDSGDWASAMPLRVGQEATGLHSSVPTAAQAHAMHPSKLPSESQIMDFARRQVEHFNALRRGDPIQPYLSEISDIQSVGPGAGITEGAFDSPFDIESQIRGAGGYSTATDPRNPFSAFDPPQGSGNYIHPELAMQGIE